MSRKNQRNNKKKRSPIAAFFRGVVVFIISTLIVGFLTSCIVAGYMFTNIMIFVNGEKQLNLADAKKNQRQTSIIYGYDKPKKKYVEMARLHGTENRVWVDLDKTPKNLQNAFVAIEDKRFHEHKGVDWYSTASVMVNPNNLGQGGSTITQQLIKNLTGQKDVTFVRKFKEILLALNLEKNYNKDAIIEAYMNTIYLGSGCNGVKTAAEYYFGKDVSKLNLAECACLAAITKSPYTYDPTINPETNKERQIYCLKQMLSQGMISADEYAKAAKYKLVFAENEEEEEEEQTDEIQSYYVDFVISRVIDDLIEEKGMSQKDAWEKVYYGGLKIYSAIDFNIQSIMEDVFENRITFPYEEDTEENPAAQAAMTIVDYKGHVVGIVGGAGKKPSNRCLNRAYDSPRQPGSTIKPLATYAPAINEGLIGWGTAIQNSAFDYYGNMFPHNFDGTLGSGGYVTVQSALAQSLNTVPARIINEKLTINTSVDYLVNKFHITTLDMQRDADLAPTSIGAMTYGMTTLEMAEAFSVFGSGGVYRRPCPYTKITNADGSEIVLEDDDKGEQVLAKGTADVMVKLLETVVIGGTGSGYGVYNQPTYAKTGTTDDDKDRLFNGGTPYYCASVWYGYDNPKEIWNVYGNPAGALFHEVMNRVHENLDEKEFNFSDSTQYVAYCATTGLRAGDYCPIGGYGWYNVDSMPCCSEHGGY